MRRASLRCICFSVSILLASCGSKKSQEDEWKAVCLAADVSLTDERIIITNTGDQPWTKVDVSFLEGGKEDEDNSFSYSYPKSALHPRETVMIPLSQFVRDDGLRYDSTKYSMQGILIGTETPHGTFITGEHMAVNSRGMYLNDCERAEKAK